MWTMYKHGVLSKGERLARGSNNQDFELDQQQERWDAVFTAECGFFSAARLQRLFSLRFPASIERDDRSSVGPDIRQGRPPVRSGNK
jgi:hypothetical protein